MEKNPGRVNNWYSKHPYTVCHLLECMPAFPELAPAGQAEVTRWNDITLLSPGGPRYSAS